MDKFVAEGENEMSEKELNDDKLQHGDLNVLDQFFTTKLENVTSKSSYLFDVMNTYKKTSKAVPGHSVDAQNATQVPVRGLNEKKIKQLTDRTGYNLEVTTGQRKYGGPPPGWEGQPPGVGCEVFCGKVPKDVYEDELVPLFETCGRIWDLRLMMNPLTGSTRGYAFVTFTNREEAQKAVQELENYEIRHGKNLKINISVPNLRLFVGNIPKSKGKEEILEEFGKLTAGLVDVIIYSSPDDKKKNRGFCFLEYESHKAASIAKRRLGTGRVKIWRCSIIVDWADPQEEPDEQRMSKVKVLYARNLTQEITEEKLKEEFEAFGKVERVKKIKDYAFIHFEDRDQAVKAMESLDSKELGGSNIEVTLAKPPSDKKKKEEILRARERRMMQVKKSMMPGTYPPRGQGDSRAGIMRLPPIGRVDYDFSDYRGSYIDPYFDDYSYYDFPPTLSPPRGRGARLLTPKLEEPGIPGGFYDFSSGSQSSRGRGQVPRGSTGIRRARRGGSTRGTRRTIRPGGRGMSRPRST